MVNPLAWMLGLPIRAYRCVISPLIPPRCKYYPTCSTYALQCLNKHGAVKGVALSVWRIARCNPWSMGGVDLPPLKGQWRAEEALRMSDQELAEHFRRLDEAALAHAGGSSKERTK